MSYFTIGEGGVMKKLSNTPKSRIRSVLRQLWLRSRERAAAIKRDKYTCQRCGAKQSRAKGQEVYVEVHHVKGIDWEGVIDIIQDRILRPPEELETLCVECHKREGEGK